MLTNSNNKCLSNKTQYDNIFKLFVHANHGDKLYGGFLNDYQPLEALYMTVNFTYNKTTILMKKNINIYFQKI